MKTIKKSIFVLGLATAGLLSAQSSDMTNMLKIGANAGVALPAENASAAAGIDLAYQNLATPGFGIGLATGYTHYFGKLHKHEIADFDNNDFGVVPVAALLRVYPKQTGFYLGADLGYGFIVGPEKVYKGNAASPDRPDGGFYMKPEIGYHNRDWNFAVQYQKVFTGNKGEIEGIQKYSVGALGLGVSYNIPLGK